MSNPHDQHGQPQYGPLGGQPSQPVPYPGGQPQQYGPPSDYGYPPPPPPPPKSNNTPALLMISAVVFLLLAGGCFALVVSVNSGPPERESRATSRTRAPAIVPPDGQVSEPATQSAPDAPATTAAQVDEPTAALTQPAVTQPAPPAERKVLLTDSGDGKKNTQQFTVDSSWEIHYTYDCTGSSSGTGIFSIWVKDGPRSVDLAANESGTKEDTTTPQYEAGTFHLEISSLFCNWTVEVADVP